MDEKKSHDAEGEVTIKRKKIKRKWRFSEKVIFSILAFSVLVFCLSMVFAFITQNDTVWAYLLPAVGVLASSAFAIFTWKEKNENLPKILNNPDYDEEQLIKRIQNEMENEFIELGKNRNY